MADVESLALQVTGDVKSAEDSINSLINTLDRLKKATAGGCGLGSLNTAIQQISSSSVSKLNALSNALSGLSKVSQIKLSSSIASQISAIGTAIQAQSGVDYSKLSELATALQPLASIGKSNLGSIVTQLKKLPEAANALNEMDLTAFKAKIREVADAIKPLADEMQKVSAGFAAFPTQMQKFTNGQSKVSASNQRTTLSFAKLAAKMTVAIMALRRIANVVASWIKESNDYIENMNLFKVAMGEYAEAAKETADKVGDALGIDPSTWVRTQGVFMTLATGFGVAGDRASVMSEQLTQLGYDLSSFYNISVEDAMQKLQSGISGELEPLRRLGYDLSQAKLEAVAMSLGIDKAVSSMTQAEKSELRYYAIMTQVTSAQGDMARTIEDPANQLRVLTSQLTQAARACGNAFIPALNAVLPYAIAVVKVIRLLAETIASLFGYEAPDLDFDSSITTGATSASEAMDEATGSAQKLKKMLLGIDELNVMSDNSSGGGAGSDYGGGGFDFDLPTYQFYDENAKSAVNAIVNDMKEWLGLTEDIDSWSELMDTRFGSILTTVGLIGAALAAWSIATGVLKAITALKAISSKNVSLSFSILGVAMAMSDLDKLKQYFEDFKENGATFKNVSGMLSEFAGLIGDAMILLGGVKVGGALKVVQGVGEIVSSINAMATEGVDVTNMTDLIRGITNIVAGISILVGRFDIAGWAISLQGFTTIFQELAENWEAIKNGDWSGVDKTTLVIGAIEAIGGIVTALIAFKKLKDAADVGAAAKGVKDVATTTETISTTTSTMTAKLTTLAKDLALGIVIIAEIAAAAALFVGAIWLLGVELEQVGIAWEPVMANGETIITAIGLGTAVLVAVGLIAAALGTAGAPLIVNIALGTAILGEIGIAAALFLAEILAVGMLLDEIGIAWEPVLNNGENIATAIGVGTGILVAIGVVAAALGAATVATAGALPLAIGLGAGLLAELGIAAAAFLTGIRDVAGYLEEIGENWKPVLDNGEDIEKAIDKGTVLLIGIGAVCAVLGGATVASVGLLPVAIRLGGDMMYDLSDAFGDFSESLSEVASDIKDVLAPAVAGVNDVLPDATSDMGDFVGFMSTFATDMVVYSASTAIAGIAATIDKFLGHFLTDPIKHLSDEMADQKKKMETLVTNLRDVIPLINDATSLMTEYNDAMDKFNDESGLNGGLSGLVSTMIEIGVKLFKQGWTTISEFVGNAVSVAIRIFKDGWSTISDFVGTSVSTAVKLTKNGWSSLSSFVGNSVSVSISLAKDGWTSVKSWLGDLTAKLNITFPKFRLKWDTTTVAGFAVKYPSGIETYARGGFPDMGQLFIAREAGPEMVGSIGSRTAVANNDQIVEAVSRGVYDAVVSAMGQTGGAQVVEAKVNDKVLFEVVVDRNRQETMRTGYSPLLGGV